jgi:hypothetical protein
VEDKDYDRLKGEFQLPPTARKALELVRKNTPQRGLAAHRDRKIRDHHAMKSKNALLSAVAALAIGAGAADAMAATTPDAADFAAAKAQGTVEAMQGFVAAHPTSPLAAEAVTQIAQLSTPAENPSFLDKLKSFFEGMDSVGQTGSVGSSAPGGLDNDRDNGNEHENSEQHSIY